MRQLTPTCYMYNICLAYSTLKMWGYSHIIQLMFRGATSQSSDRKSNISNLSSHRQRISSASIPNNFFIENGTCQVTVESGTLFAGLYEDFIDLNSKQFKTQYGYGSTLPAVTLTSVIKFFAARRALAKRNMLTKSLQQVLYLTIRCENLIVYVRERTTIAAQNRYNKEPELHFRLCAITITGHFHPPWCQYVN